MDADSQHRCLYIVSGVTVNRNYENDVLVVTAMRTRIEISDTLIENVVDTVSADINPPAPLAIVFSYDGAMARSYMEYDTGLLELIKNICKNNRFVRKLKIEIELENEEVKDDA